MVPFFSARSAMVEGLRVFGLERMDEILVPPYLGQCVLSAILRTAFPTMTPSIRTKAILVYHQFGFPQKLEEIEAAARDNGWLILNDCANTIFTKTADEHYLVDWGDLTIVSFSKLYHCGQGGALWTGKKDLSALFSERSEGDRESAREAFDFYLDILQNAFGQKTQNTIQALYGFLPDIKTLARKAAEALPGTVTEIQKDIERRKNIYSLALDIFGNLVPHCPSEIVPFAIPISGDRERLFMLSAAIMETFKAAAPVLHFDYARNMLAPEYKTALVVGCHDEWEDPLIHDIFDLIKKGLA